MATKKTETKEVATQTTGAEIVVNNKFIDDLVGQLKEKEKFGLSFPADYNPANALNGAYLILKETVDRNKQPVLNTCTKTSIANCLMDMVTQGLSMQKKQCYPIAYGQTLTCQISYHGYKAMAHRYGAKSIIAEVIYDGDEFKYHIEDGRKVIDEHKQDFMNIDSTKIKGAYCVVTMQDGTKYVEIMNIQQIKMAWKKGSNYKEGGNGVHADFTDMMAKKTVTSRACKQIVNQYGDAISEEFIQEQEKQADIDVVAEDVTVDVEENANTVDFDEAVIIEEETPVEQEVVIEQEQEEDDPNIPDFMKVE